MDMIYLPFKICTTDICRGANWNHHHFIHRPFKHLLQKKMAVTQPITVYVLGAS